MPRQLKGNVFDSRGRWYCRFRLSKTERPAFLLTCNTREEADERAAVLADFASRLRDAQQLAHASDLLGRAAACSPEALPAMEKVVRTICAGQVALASRPDEPTFRWLADRWTNGALQLDYPDHEKKKRSAETDVHRLKHILPIVGDVPLKTFSLDHGDQVMRALPMELSPATRRHVAQVLHRVLTLAVFPCRLISANPLPPGWLPKLGPKVAKAYLYPDEERLLLGCTAIPLVWRLLYGFLHREGCRRSEALALQWSDVDLKRGALALDKNKTDDPRAWALRPDTLKALRLWWVLLGEPGPDEHVFVDEADHVLADDHTAARYRADLERAGVDRPQLFERSSARRPIRFHDTRATFVTIALANGKTEAWVADRTGHRSSDQIGTYRRAARTVAELGLGDLCSLALAVPELASVEHEGAAARRQPEGAAQRAADTSRRWRNWQTHWIQVPAGTTPPQQTVGSRCDSDVGRDGSAPDEQAAALSGPSAAPLANILADAAPPASCAATSSRTTSSAPSPRTALLAKLGAELAALTEAGDVEAAQAVHETIGRLLAGRSAPGGEPSSSAPSITTNAGIDRDNQSVAKPSSITVRGSVVPIEYARRARGRS